MSDPGSLVPIADEQAKFGQEVLKTLRGLGGYLKPIEIYGANLAFRQPLQPQHQAIKFLTPSGRKFCAPFRIDSSLDGNGPNFRPMSEAGWLHLCCRILCIADSHQALRAIEQMAGSLRRRTDKMRTATLCALGVMLAAVSLSSGQAEATTLTVHTQTPRVNVHVPPPRVSVQPSSPNVVGHSAPVSPRDQATGMPIGKRQH